MAGAGTPTPNFPSSLDVPETFNSTDQRSTIILSAWLTKFWAAIVALETVVGVTASAVTSTIINRLSEVVAGDKAVGKTATQTLTNKTLTSPVINSPTGLAKGDVGLGSVDNTADSAKPVSTAQQTALNLKANAAAPSFTGIVTSAGAINEAKGTNIASATTTDIGAATGNYVDVTGTTTITGLGTIAAGTRRIVQFSGILTLTHNATSLILPTGANISTAAGDVAQFISLGSGDWKCVMYSRANGQPLATASSSFASCGVSTLTTGTVNITHNLGTTPTKLKFEANFVMVNAWASDQITRTSGVAIISGGTITSGAAVAFSQDATHAFNTGGQSMTSTTAGRVLLNAKYSDTYLTVSAVTSTQFTLTWTLANHGGTNDTINNIAILWQASA
jgi:hypothetical protein